MHLSSEFFLTPGPSVLDFIFCCN